MITGYINGQELRISSPALAADSIKYLEAEFHFAGHDWDGFTKTAYFLNDGKKIALTLADNRITADMGLNLTEGEWAVKLSGVKGDARITTTTQRLYVRGFGSTDGELPDVTATQAEQLQAQIGDLADLETESKDNLVAAINEAAQSGGGGGGTADHTKLKNRDAAEQHPMSAITGLEAALDGKAAKTDKLANPYALTFTGAASGTYDGSEAASITIPDAADIKIYATLDDFIAHRFTNRAAMVLNAPSATITPGAWSDVNFPALAYTSGVSHGEATIYLTSCTSAKKCSVSLQMDGSYRGPYAIATAADHTLGLTSATVGQIAKISAVDDNGAPTAWEAVDMLSGGGGDWELFAEQTVEEEVWYIEVSVEKPYKSILIIDDMPQASIPGILTIRFNNTVVFNGVNFMTDQAQAYTRKRAYVLNCAEPYVLAIVSNATLNQIGDSIPIFSYKLYNNGPVTSIKYGGITNNRLLPVGTHVKFYGR